MTNPPEPDRPHPENPGPGRPGGPGRYGPPSPPGPPLRPSSHPGDPGPYQPPPVPAPRPAEPEYSRKGFLGALFDLSFDHTVTIKLIRLVYVFAIVFSGLTALAMLLLAWSFAEWNGVLAFVTLVATPIVVPFQIIVVRMVLEFMINQFKITEELRKIRESGKVNTRPMP